MGIISEVKCGRCDRRYSAMRARCPYCGARRGGRGKFSGDSDNSKVHLTIGILILVALIAAVTVLLLTSNAGTDTGTDAESPTPTNGDSTPNIPDSNTNSSIDDPDYTPPPESPTPPEETPAPTLESVTITYNGRKMEDFTEPVGKTLTLAVKLVPEGLDLTPVWESSNPEAFDVVPTDTTGLTVKVTMISPTTGEQKLKVTVGDKTAECIVRVR
ncbi:MAG: hypothetical protein LBL25_02200 [Oscillospiraceae bacterium]|nr:hypothetical protein [Oscillospiraceae bacterium]